MSIQIQFAITIMSLIAGMIAVFLANRIMRRYKFKYLTSYFYFLIFLYIFSVYSVIGSESIARILVSHDTEGNIIQSAQAILIALGIPFLVLSLYMFVRISHEFCQVEIPKLFSVLYFSLFALTFLGYGLINLDIGSAEAIKFFLNTTQLHWTFSILMISIPGYALIFAIHGIRKISDVNKRETYYWFSIWYTAFIIFLLASLHLTRVSELFGLFFIAILTGFHLVPVLFLNIYLQKHHLQWNKNEKNASTTEQFLLKYEISKRESEIVQLICQGMSNQEISDSLYISLQTVKDHVHRIFTKTGVKNRVQLANLVTSEQQNER